MSTTSRALLPSTLPIVGECVYHLSASVPQLARNVLIVGDPDRVSLIADRFLSHIESETFHRGLRMITGSVESGMRLTIVTSGMGTPSLEIVFNELVALNEIDIATLVPKNPRPPPLRIIRIGTCGTIQPEIAMGTCIITSYALGLDNTGQYYDAPATAVDLEIERTVKAALVDASPHTRFGARLDPYCASVMPEMWADIAQYCLLHNVPYKIGITASAAGFFGNQGRQLLPCLKPTVPDIDNVLSKIRFDGSGCVPAGTRIENMEMEASTLIHLGNMVGYPCGAICIAAAQRRTGDFLANQIPYIEKAIRAAIDALEYRHKKN
jgi:uridine phosphorylase